MIRQTSHSYSKIVAGALAAGMVLSAAPVNVLADNQFSAIVQDIQTANENAKLPSYATFKLVPADSVSENTEKDQLIHEYQRVELQDFEKFGDYLEQEGYQVTDIFNDNGIYVLNMSSSAEGGSSGETVSSDDSEEAVSIIDSSETEDGAKEFAVSYDSKKEILQCIYYGVSTPVNYPVFINDLNGSANDGCITFDEKKEDRFGNIYAHSVSGWGRNVVVSWLAEEKYSTFAATIAVPADEEENNNQVCIVVNADGEEVFRSGEIRPQTAPQQFSVDISKVNSVEVVFEGDYYGQAALFNGVFY